MNHTIKLVVFDMAGTTIEENNLVYKSLLLTIVQNGYECTLEEVLAHGAGKEKRNAIEDILKVIQDEIIDSITIDKLYNKFKYNLEIAYEHAMISAKDNAEIVFEKINNQGIYIVLNTGYDRLTATKLLNKLNWFQSIHYDLLVTATDVTNSRPHPDMIIKAISHFNIDDAQSVLKIGDSAIDILEGKNANCGITIGITTGAQTREQLSQANPDYIIDNLIDLLPIINL